MPGMDLATLSIPDLRRVLELARAREQTDLVNSVLAELRARGGAPTAGVAADTPAMSFGAEPARMVVAGMRDGTWWDDEDPDLSPRRRAPIVILGIAAAVVIAGAAGWGLTRMGVLNIAMPATPSPVATPKSAAPVATPMREAAQAEPAPAEAPSPVSVADASPQPPPAAPVLSAKPPVADAPAPSAAAAEAARTRASCLTRPTPADRLVCGYPTLGRQHDRMLAAYNRALVMSGSDPQALDADQANWRAGRDKVSDWRQLSALYTQRIRDLDALAARPAPEAESEARPKPEQPIF